MNHSAIYILQTNAHLTLQHTVPSVHSLFTLAAHFMFCFFMFCFWFVYSFRWVDNGYSEWLWKKKLSSINTFSGIWAFERTLNSYICWHSEYFHFIQFSKKNPSLSSLWWMILHIVISGLFKCIFNGYICWHSDNVYFKWFQRLLLTVIQYNTIWLIVPSWLFECIFNSHICCHHFVSSNTKDVPCFNYKKW